MTDEVLTRFCDAFEALGYRTLTGVPLYSDQDRWYRAEWAGGPAVNLAFLEYKPKQRAYALRVGATTNASRDVLDAAKESIARYVHPAIAAPGWALFRRPCWTLFDVGRGLDWPLLSIPDPLDRGAWWSQLSGFIERILDPVLRPLEDPEDIIRLLQRDDVPFDWAASNGVLRVAEIVALGVEAELDREAIRHCLTKHEPHVVRDICGGFDYHHLLDAFLLAFGSRS